MLNLNYTESINEKAIAESNLSFIPTEFNTTLILDPTDEISTLEQFKNLSNYNNTIIKKFTEINQPKFLNLVSYLNLNHDNTPKLLESVNQISDLSKLNIKNHQDWNVSVFTDDS